MTNVLTNLSYIHVNDSYLSTINPSIKSSPSSLLKHLLNTDINEYINKDKVKQLIDFSQIKPSVKDYVINNKYIFAQIQGYANIAEPLNANANEEYDDLDVVEKTESKYLQGDDDANTNSKNESVVYKLKFTNGVDEFYGFEYNKFNNEILTMLKECLPNYKKENNGNKYLKCLIGPNVEIHRSIFYLNSSNFKLLI